MSTKTVLITGARSFAALDLARMFHSAGIKVICADSMEKSICQYSAAVSRFYKIASPVFYYESFVADLQKIIKNEKIDLLIPTCEEVFYIGMAKQILKTEVFAENFEKLEILHNKWKFAQLLEKFGLNTPETHLWEGEARQGKWVLKPIFSRFAANVQVIEGNWPEYKPNLSNPLIAQAFIEGEKFCTYSLCREGVITAHGVYKVLHAMGMGSSICFESVSHPEIDDFVTKFVAETSFTGQIAFDFIDGDKLYCLECNPRATSGVHLFSKSPELSPCFFNKKLYLTPALKTIMHEHLFMLWYGLKQKEIFCFKFWQHFFAGQSPLWMKGDNMVIACLPFMLWGIAKETLFSGKGFNQVMSRDIEYNGSAL